MQPSCVLCPSVEESTTSCTDEPVAAGDTPEEDSTLFVLPYQEVVFNVSFMSQAERCVTPSECLLYVEPFKIPTMVSHVS